MLEPLLPDPSDGVGLSPAWLVAAFDGPEKDFDPDELFPSLSPFGVESTSDGNVCDESPGAGVDFDGVCGLGVGLGVICGVSFLGDADEEGVAAPAGAGVEARVLTGMRRVTLWIGLSAGPLVEALLEWFVLESVTAPTMTKMMTTAENTSCLSRALEMITRVENRLVVAASLIDW